MRSRTEHQRRAIQPVVFTRGGIFGLAVPDGHVWTTAEVDWDMSKAPEIISQQTDPHFRWKCSEAIRTPRETTYSFAATWGSSDRDVFMGTFQGAILRWTGAQWRVSYCESANSVQRMHCTVPENIWAVGRNGPAPALRRKSLARCSNSGGAEDGENFNGVWALSAEEAVQTSILRRHFTGVTTDSNA